MANLLSLGNINSGEEEIEWNIYIYMYISKWLHGENIVLEQIIPIGIKSFKLNYDYSYTAGKFFFSGSWIL